MRPVIVDTETFLFGPGLRVPPLVSIALDRGNGKPELYNRDPGMVELVKLLVDDETLLVGQNLSYDLAVCAEYADSKGMDLMPRIFAMLDRCRAGDTMLREALIKIADGTYVAGVRHSLAKLAKKYIGIELDKGDDGWRKRYSELVDVPVAQWPERADKYAREDVMATRAVWMAQQLGPWGGATDVATAGDAHGIPDEFAQVRAAWALHLTSAWGMRTDAERVRMLTRSTDEVLVRVATELGGTGLLMGLSRNDKAIRHAVEQDFLAQGRDVKETEGGDTSITAEVLRSCAASQLQHLADFVEAQYVKSNALKVLWSGVDHPVNTEYEVVIKTGRTSSREPNVQNFRRAGGIRECFVPRAGYLYCSVDYETLELRTLAQCLHDLFGETAMVRALRAGWDLHVAMAATILHLGYDEAYGRYKAKDPEVKAKRQFAKAPNFGLPGGMGPDGLVTYAASMGIPMTKAEAEFAVQVWHQTFPEMRPYFGTMKRLLKVDGTGGFVHPISGRIYGKGYFTEICNAQFQGRAADGAKAALYEATYRCYCDRKSALFGCRPVAFLHDEILMEVPDDKEAAHKAAFELAKLMCEQMSRYCPAIPIKAKPALMRRWYKEAEDVYDDKGFLTPWEPK